MGAITVMHHIIFTSAIINSTDIVTMALLPKPVNALKEKGVISSLRNCALTSVHGSIWPYISLLFCSASLSALSALSSLFSLLSSLSFCPHTMCTSLGVMILPTRSSVTEKRMMRSGLAACLMSNTKEPNTTNKAYQADTVRWRHVVR